MSHGQPLAKPGARPEIRHLVAKHPLVAALGLYGSQWVEAGRPPRSVRSLPGLVEGPRGKRVNDEKAIEALGLKQ